MCNKYEKKSINFGVIMGKKGTIISENELKIRTLKIQKSRLYYSDFESFGHKPLSKSESIYFVFTDR